jgi:hypothetical protein
MMLYEATIAFLSLMLLTWAAAVWASYQEEGSSKASSSREENDQRSVA